MKHEYRHGIPEWTAAMRFAGLDALKASPRDYAALLAGITVVVAAAVGTYSLLRFYKQSLGEDLDALNVALICIAMVVAANMATTQINARLIHRQLFRPGGLHHDTHSIELTDTHAVITVRANTYAYAYTDIQRIDRDGTNIYAVLGPAAVLYFPLKSFASPEAATHFADEFRARLDAAHPAPTPEPQPSSPSLATSRVTDMSSENSRTVARGWYLGLGLIIPIVIATVAGNRASAYIYQLGAEDDVGEYADFGKDYAADVSIDEFHDVRRGNQVTILGTLSNRGEKDLKTISIEAEFFNDKGEFVYEKSEYINTTLSPGEKENFQIECGCKDKEFPEYKTVTVRAVSATSI